MNDPELQAMNTIYGTLKSLDEAARARVLRWAEDKLEISALPAQRVPNATMMEPSADSFREVGDVLQATRPATGPERALAVAYWLQEVNGHSDGWGGREVNDILKNTGHGLANVTATLDSLKSRNPQLVMQVGKAGRSRQARKTYKLTTAGVRVVREMINRSEQEAA